MATREDYFDHYRVVSYSYDASVADLNAGDAVRDIYEGFKLLIDALDFKADSDWDYACQCRGTVVSVDCEDWNMETFEPRDIHCEHISKWMRDQMTERHVWYVPHTLIELWESWEARLTPVYEWLDRTAWHLDRCPRHDWWSEGNDDYRHRRDRKIDERRQRVADAYIEMLNKCCEELGAEVDSLMRDACDYAYSDEAADEWVAAQDDAA